MILLLDDSYRYLFYLMAPQVNSLALLLSQLAWNKHYCAKLFLLHYLQQTSGISIGCIKSNLNSVNVNILLMDHPLGHRGTSSNTSIGHLHERRSASLRLHGNPPSSSPRQHSSPTAQTEQQYHGTHTDKRCRSRPYAHRARIEQLVVLINIGTGFEGEARWGVRGDQSFVRFGDQIVAQIDGNLRVGGAGTSRSTVRTVGERCILTKVDVNRVSEGLAHHADHGRYGGVGSGRGKFQFARQGEAAIGPDRHTGILEGNVPGGAGFGMDGGEITGQQEQGGNYRR